LDTKLKNIRVAAVIALVGAILLSYGLMVGEDFDLVRDSPEFEHSLRAQNISQSALSWARHLHYTAVDPDSARHDAYKEKLAHPHPFYYYVKEGVSAATTNVIVTEDVVTFFRDLPLTDFVTDDKTGLIAYIGLAEPAFRGLAEVYYAERARALVAFYYVLGGLLLSLFGVALSVVTVWRTTDTAPVRKLLWEYIPLDLAFAGLVGLSPFGIRVMLDSRRLYLDVLTAEPLVVGLSTAVALTLLGLLWVNMAAKRLKRGEFWRHTLLGALILGALRLAPTVVSHRQGVLFCAYAVASIFLVLTFVFVGEAYSLFASLIVLAALVALNAAASLYVVNHAKEIQSIANGAETIRRGETTHRIPAKRHKDLNAIAEHINDIAEGLERAVSSRVKAERMKVELITNVSHDLKTPLTSLIAYIDLLKKEGLSAESAPKYLEVLEQKSERLKTLTDDLFEAVKAASGNVLVNWEVIHVPSFLAQGLGELSDRISAKQLDFRVNTREEQLQVRADGKLLWRAIENVLTNVLKYAVPASRVYVDAVAAGDDVLLTIKNMSALPLNTPPEELMERFVRGDEARSSEGSGLGLSIAKSLLELQQGTLAIEIDGDLFKVIMKLPRLY